MSAPKLTKFDKSLVATVALRPQVPAEFIPLFDHCINLAKSAHRLGSYTRAGMDLAHARRIVTKYGKE